MYRLHFVKFPTPNKDVFPYTHFADLGHNPNIYIEKMSNSILLICQDIFKLKPNVQKSPRTRVDVYMPSESAFEIGKEIVAFLGEGKVAEKAVSNPDDFRRGPQTLPLIDESRTIQHAGTFFEIAGVLIGGEKGSVYIDRERPNEGHIEMRGAEVHIGIPLTFLRVTLNREAIKRVEVPRSELRVGGESNPINKADGVLRINFLPSEAKKLSATLIHYSQGMK